MLCLNKIQLIGWLGADPRLAYTPSNSAICSFHMATSRWNEINGEWKRFTHWHQIEVWGNTRAPALARDLVRGSRVYVEGEQRTKRWTTPEGQYRYRSYVWAERVILFDKQPSSEKSNSESTWTSEEQVDDQAVRAEIESGDEYEKDPGAKSEDVND